MPSPLLVESRFGTAVEAILPLVLGFFLQKNGESPVPCLNGLEIFGLDVMEDSKDGSTAGARQNTGAGQTLAAAPPPPPPPAAAPPPRPPAAAPQVPAVDLTTKPEQAKALQPPAPSDMPLSTSVGKA